MISDIFKGLNIEEEVERDIALDNVSDVCYNEEYGQSPPSAYAGAECPSPSFSIDIPIPNDKEEKSDLHMNGESMPRLQKASSVPQIHSGSPRRKKTSEASPLPDPTMLGNLMRENQILRDNLVKLKEKNMEIIAINHDWDKSYNTLAQQHGDLQKQFQRSNEQLSNEIVKKEEEKNRMKAKLERFFNEGSLDEKSLLVEEKEEKNKILKREQAALQTAKEFQMKCQHLDHILRQTTQQKAHLERELQRLSLCMENQKSQQNYAVVNDGATPNHPSFNADVNEIDLLRQQLQTYVEDFDAEKNEKQRLSKENAEIKRKLDVVVDENEHLKTQLQIYEKDFSREREKRIQLMRKSNPMSRAVHTQAYSQINQSLPRSAPPYTFPKMDRLFDEETMHARGILTRSIPEKGDGCINNCGVSSSNPTNSSNSWSYFGP